MSPKQQTTEPGFAAALAELEQVLSRIEDDSLDVDKLAAELERAATLLELCRGKIRKAELEVAAVVQKLEPAKGD